MKKENPVWRRLRTNPPPISEDPQIITWDAYIQEMAANNLREAELRKIVKTTCNGCGAPRDRKLAGGRLASKCTACNLDRKRQYRLRHYRKKVELGIAAGTVDETKTKAWRRAHRKELQIAARFRECRKAAAKRKSVGHPPGLEFTLTPEQYAAVITAPACLYCGGQQSNGFLGVDREDPAVGYIPINCLPACTRCNRSKHLLTADELLDLARTITDRVRASGVPRTRVYRNERPGSNQPNHRNIDARWDLYRVGAHERGREFAITKEHFKLLVTAACRYCGIVASDRWLMGIDRMDNRFGYTLNNSVSCCKVCNLAKGSRSCSEFLDWMAAIASREDPILLACRHGIENRRIMDDLRQQQNAIASELADLQKQQRKLEAERDKKPPNHHAEYIRAKEKHGAGVLREKNRVWLAAHPGKAAEYTRNKRKKAKELQTLAENS